MAQNASREEFDRIISDETQFVLTLQMLLDEHAGWYLDRCHADGTKFEGPPGVRHLSGVYLLWQGISFCEFHSKEIFRAVYVGKAGRNIELRFSEHFKTKILGRGMAVEITTWAASNRQAKYVEQLLLDTFRFEANRSENPGTRELHVHIDPGEWN